MEYRQTNNSLTRGARVHAYAVLGLLRPLRWGYASLLVLELCFTVRADTGLIPAAEFKPARPTRSEAVSLLGLRPIFARALLAFLARRPPS